MPSKMKQRRQRLTGKAPQILPYEPNAHDVAIERIYEAPARAYCQLRGRDPEQVDTLQHQTVKYALIQVPHWKVVAHSMPDHAVRMLALQATWNEWTKQLGTAQPPSASAPAQPAPEAEPKPIAEPPASDAAPESAPESASAL